MKWFAKNFEEVIGSVALSIVLVVVVFNVIMRYIFNTSFNWAEEIATIGFVWVVFIGSSGCYKRKMHIGVDVLVRFFPDNIARMVSMGVNGLLVIANIYLTYLSLVFSVTAWIKPTTVLLIPYTFVDISATIGFTLMTIYSIRNFINDLKGKKEDSEKEEKDAGYLAV